ncbi:MAG: HAMP domain-containing histidine kinase [Lachnospiraceae bacterium]|nr:HAMP domain-containing histidine kinase [Lachnospiraceae bacterium]
MRLYAKIFLCGIAIFSTAFLLAGYLLLMGAYKNELDREREIALKQYQYDKFTVQSELIYEWQTLDSKFGGEDRQSYGEEEFLEKNSIFESLIAKLGEGTAFYLERTRPLISNLPDGIDDTLVQDLEENAISYQFQNIGEESYLLTGGKIVQEQIAVYMLRVTDITTITERHQQLTEQFQKMYLAALAISMSVMLILSAFITKPLKKITLVAKRIAQGDYEERILSRGSDEIAELIESFNVMADSIEEKVEELSKALRQKEEFVANFAHELKTPLTSVIGYADMLYQRELPGQERKEAAWYIMNEGMRLEALSLKLMDLFVMGKNQFLLEEMEIGAVLENVLQGMEPILQEKGVNLIVKADSAYIKVEIDLFKTLIWNLIDNSIKAGSSKIHILGICQNSHYLIQVIDNGCGIPENEIEKITEAFYMVDKSRSRKQHGAGLGLALAEQIARIHGSILKIESREQEGTMIALELYCEGEMEDV